MKPDVLLLDEPTSALDPELVGEVEKSIADAAKSGQTMVLVSHDMNFVAQVSDKVLFLEKGKILEQGTPDQLFNHPQEERTKEFFASYKKSYVWYNKDKIEARLASQAGFLVVSSGLLKEVSFWLIKWSDID